MTDAYANELGLPRTTGAPVRDNNVSSKAYAFLASNDETVKFYVG